MGVPVALPASRKVRALAAYLALATRPLGRTHLCELLWDEPSDPRGELRWCLSKLRGVFDTPGRRRIESSGDLIRLDLNDCYVDAHEVAAATQSGVGLLDSARLRELAALFAGELLDGLQMDGHPHFDTWLIGQRRRFHACRTAILEQLVRSLPAESDEVFGSLEQWVELARLDQRAHEYLLRALTQRGRMREAEVHLAATVRLFQTEGLDATPLRDAWRDIRGRESNRSASVTTGPELLTPESPKPTTRRASIAVMPLVEATSEGGARGGVADGLSHDIITRLAKLRSVAVIARGSVFALSERSVGPEEAGRTLNVDYVASGSVRRPKGRIIVTMELIETHTARIVWAEDFDYKIDDAFLVLDEIGNRIVSSIASEIEAAERNRALLKHPNSLDAWEAYHRGLWHMYRFNGPDNDQAHQFFQMAVRLDPTFARAHAGLSFTHWQNAFLHRTAERTLESDRALACAEQSLLVDDRDPAAHWAMGRALWLRGQQDESLRELDRAIDLSPNFALGHYTLSFVHSQSGDPRAAIRYSDHSRHLSPFDPLLFAMLTSRALAHVRLGELDEAASWSINAIARPNAHNHVRAIAAHCLALAGRHEEARAITAQIHKSQPQYRIDDFLTAFHFAPDLAATFRQCAKTIGLD
jgi:DNA-binding SARP family transcriptional activator